MEQSSASIYLASQSPRRREILQQIGVPHQVISASVTESPLISELASDYVQRLALEKAMAGLAQVGEQQLTQRPVLGADTIVVCDGDILEKPRDQVHFSEMMQRLSGRTHQVMTAVALVDSHKQERQISITEVDFRNLNAQEIDAYWKTTEPHDKAGGYAIQGLGAVFVEQLRGSYSGVVGLPIDKLIFLLAAFDINMWQ